MNFSKILKMMEFVLLNPEKYDEEYIKNKFGDKNYNIFSQFCLGGPIDMQLAHYIGPGKLKLTQRGVREYHRLKSEQTQRTFNLMMIFATIVLAASSIANIII